MKRLITLVAAALALVAVFRLKLGIAPVLGGAALTGVGLHLVGLA